MPRSFLLYFMSIVVQVLQNLVTVLQVLVTAIVCFIISLFHCVILKTIEF